MSPFNKSYFTVLCFCFGVAIFPLARPSSFHVEEAKSVLFSTFPHELGQWKGIDVEVDERTFEILETRNVLSRNYANARGDKVHLLLVSSRKDRRVAHPPEVCYLGSNYSIVEESHGKVTIAGSQVPVKRFVAESERDPSYHEQVMYLYKVGDRYTTNYYAQQIQFALDMLTRQDSEVLLIRLAGKNREVHEEFLGEVLKVAGNK